MTTSYRSSSIRLGVGIVAFLGAAIMAFVVLPDANRALQRERTAQRNAQASLQHQIKQLADVQALATRIEKGRERLSILEQSMPQGSIGQLQWTLSHTLFELAKKHLVRIQGVKYGLPNRESTKGTDLEAMDVECNVVGVYGNLKPFMLALEGSELPFAVTSVRLEESADGARLTLSLRAFRKGGPTSENPKEEA